jgi:hypothetical protein
LWYCIGIGASAGIVGMQRYTQICSHIAVSAHTHTYPCLLLPQSCRDSLESMTTCGNEHTWAQTLVSRCYSSLKEPELLKEIVKSLSRKGKVNNDPRIS